ncbi:hypothetical protein Tco_0340355 [Tanacetum coccineum]
MSCLEEPEAATTPHLIMFQDRSIRRIRCLEDTADAGDASPYCTVTRYTMRWTIREDEDDDMAIEADEEDRRRIGCRDCREEEEDT